MKNLICLAKYYIYIGCVSILLTCACNQANNQKAKALIENVKQLNKIGIENTINKNEITTYLENNSDTLNALINLLVANKHAILIEQKNIISGSTVFYTELFKQLMQQDPSFNFQSFFTELKEGEDFDYYFEKAAWVGITSNGVAYESYLYYDENNPVSPNFYHLANRVLADNKSKKRFYGVNYFCSNCNSDYYIDDKKVDNYLFAVVALTQAQADKLKETNLLSISDISHQLLTTKDINQFIKNIKEQKIIQVGHDDYFKQKIFEIKMSEFYSTSQLFETFDSSLCVITREAFSAQPYYELLQCMAYISNQKFAPTAIIDSFKQDTVSVLKYTLGKSKYRYVLNNKENFIDVNVLELINKTLSENDVNGQFYFLDNFENEGTLIYLNNLQYNFLIDKKILNVIPVESMFQTNYSL